MGNCFQDGCPSLGVLPYAGERLAVLAFLPSLATGVLIMQPVLFCIYFGSRIMYFHSCESWPQMHVTAVAPSGLLTGCFWTMGFFNAMVATAYLGDTIGYPMTQCGLIISGIWGILYFGEIRGR